MGEKQPSASGPPQAGLSLSIFHMVSMQKICYNYRKFNAEVCSFRFHLKDSLIRSYGALEEENGCKIKKGGTVEWQEINGRRFWQ